MNVENLPPHVKQLFRNRDLTVNQKVVTMMAFLPDVIPNMLRIEDHIELGMKIKRLVDEGKIRLGKFDKDFNLEVFSS
jgi:hypothetical protein